MDQNPLNKLKCQLCKKSFVKLPQVKPALRKTTTCLPQWNNHPHHYLPSSLVVEDEWGNWSGPRTVLWTKDFAMTISWTLVTLFSLVDQNCQLCMALKIFGYLLLFICFCHFFFAKFLLFIFFFNHLVCICLGRIVMFILGQRYSFSYLGTWFLERPSLQTMCEMWVFVFTKIKAVLFDNSSLFSAMDIIVLWWQYGLHQSCQ